ncbi:MAG: amidase family protein [Cyanobacteria bacterium P01_C01_bin.118]
MVALTFGTGVVQAATFDLIEATIPDIQLALDTGLITSGKLVQQYLNRIEAYDEQGPALNSIIQLNPNALETAKALDLERSQLAARGPLHGIPILLKDNIDTADLPTTAGALILDGSVPPDDAFLTQRLRDQGAIILGKTNLTEFASFVSVTFPNGFSVVGGQTLNPYGPGIFNVSGSSSGSAVAVAANLAPIAIGTETNGSILDPASSNSVVGLKPTVGLISRDGIIPISATQDTAGPITRTVEDAAILLGTLTGIDPNDPATAASAGLFFEDYTQFLNPDGLAGARLGVIRDPFISDFLAEDELLLVDQAFTDLERLGAEIIDVELPNLDELLALDASVLVYEFNTGIEAYLGSLGENAPAATLADIVAFNQANADIAIPFGQEVLAFSLAIGGDLTDPLYLEALERDVRVTATEGVDVLLEEFDLDALLYFDGIAAVSGAQSGYPSISVPAGYTESGQPLGLTFLNSAFTEPQLIELAYAYEQGTLLRVPPASTPAISAQVSVPESGSSKALLVVTLAVAGYQLRPRKLATD